MKLVYNQKEDGSAVSDTDIINEIIFTKIAYKDAVKNGYSIDDAEIDQIITSTKKVIYNDSTNLETLKAYINQLGISEEQYWDSARNEYRVLYTIGKYRDNYILSLYKKEKGSLSLDINNPETNKEFMKYYNRYIEKLKNESTIEYK